MWVLGYVSPCGWSRCGQCGYRDVSLSPHVSAHVSPHVSPHVSAHVSPRVSACTCECTCECTCIFPCRVAWNYLCSVGTFPIWSVSVHNVHPRWVCVCMYVCVFVAYHSTSLPPPSGSHTCSRWCVSTLVCSIPMSTPPMGKLHSLHTYVRP